jgi:hypothetical protein
MANYSNKTYSNTGKSSLGQDFLGHYYHKTQAKKQDILIKTWLKQTKQKLKKTNT